MRTMVAVGFALGTLALSAESGLEPRVDAAIARLKAQVPGISVAVVVDGRLVYAKGVGTISLTTQKPAGADTQYRLASVTKAIAVALLANRERFVPGIYPIVREALSAALGLPEQ
jgi:CubicO group peptidase (beta-lactamase class C family)